MELQETLLQIMEKKTHPSIGFFTRETPIDGLVATDDQFKLNAMQEFGILKDFPYFLEGVAKMPNIPSEMKHALLENAHEERYGEIDGIVSHNEMWLYTMEKLKFNRKDFESATLIQPAAAYKRIIKDIVLNGSWIEGAAAITIFLEGSTNDRREISKEGNKLSFVEVLDNHHLRKHFGLERNDLPLKKRHYIVEGDHRVAAYNGVVPYANTLEKQVQVTQVMKLMLDMWLNYREGVASAYGVPGYDKIPMPKA